MRKFSLILSVIAILWCSCGFALQYQSLQDIRTTVRDYLKHQTMIFPGENVEVIVGHLDSRLRLPKCSTKIRPFLPHRTQGTRITTVGVTCDGTHRWNVYVPVEVKIYTPVAVASRNLVKGHLINKDDVHMVKRNRRRLRNGYYRSVHSVVGHVAARNIRSGVVFTQRNVQAPVVIRRGQEVTIVARTGTLQVEMRGIAKSNGQLNQRIKVMNKSSKRLIEAVVIGRDKVEVNI